MDEFLTGFPTHTQSKGCVSCFLGGENILINQRGGASRENLGTSALAWGWTEGEPPIKHDQPVRFVSTEHEEDTRGGYWVEKTQTATVRSTTLETNDLRWTYILDASPPLSSFSLKTQSKPFRYDFFITLSYQILQPRPVWVSYYYILSFSTFYTRVVKPKIL